MESVPIKEELPKLELVPIRLEFSGLSSLPIKQKLCEMPSDSIKSEVSGIKAERNELEISQTEEPLPVNEEVLEMLPSRTTFDALDNVKMESVPIKEELPKLELVPIRLEFTGLASLPIKQELCETPCDSIKPVVSGIKAERNELEISQTEEPVPMKEEVLEMVRIKLEPLKEEVLLKPGKEESEDLKAAPTELGPVHLRECSVVLERIYVRKQGSGEEGSPNSTQGGGQEDRSSHSECSPAGPIDVYRSKPNSPSVSVTLKRRTEKLHVDLVPVLHIPFSEYKHIDWPRANTRWPSQELIAKCKETGIDLVAKQVWRPTFSKIENILLEDIDRDGGRRKDALQILLRVLQERWQDFHKTLSSYHLKTILFWACEKHPEFTKFETLGKSLNMLLDELIRQLESRAVPHYFLSAVNLLRSTEQLLELLLQVTELRRDVIAYLEIQNVFEYSPLDIGRYWYSVMNSQIRLHSWQIKFGGDVFVSSGLFE